MIKYAKAYFTRRKFDWDEQKFNRELGNFTTAHRNELNYEDFWTSRQVQYPCFAQFALSVGKIIASEAPVERQFRAQKCVYSAFIVNVEK